MILVFILLDILCVSLLELFTETVVNWEWHVWQCRWDSGSWLAQFLCYLLFANREISRSSACILVACIMLLYQVMSALYAHATGKHDVKHINKIKLMSCSDRIHYRDGCLLWDLILPKSITMISIIADIWKCGSRTLLTNGNKSRNPALG